MIYTNIIMEILVEWAKKRTPNTYSELSKAYRKKTGEWHEPHGTWDHHLGDINRSLAEKGAPPISALVIRKDTIEPGGKFWGCAPNVPERSKDVKTRMVKWVKLLNAVFDYDWDGYY